MAGSWSVWVWRVLTSWTVLLWTSSLCRLRVAALMSTAPSAMSLKLRLRHAVATVVKAFAYILWAILWSVDEVLYGGYRDVIVDDVVFIVSTQRTGSTNLTEAILFDDRDFFCPNGVELLFPFICVQRVLDLCVWIGSLFHFDVKESLNQLAARAEGVGDDLLDEHPMHLFTSNQPELLYGMWLCVGPMAMFLFPDGVYFQHVSLLTSLDEETYQRVHELRTLCLQKTAYRRGNGRRIIFKGHCSEDLSRMASLYPRSQFIVGSRRPSKGLASHLSLVDTGVTQCRKMQYSMLF
jgi:hypothetical protein